MSENWEQIKEIVASALELPLDERDSFVEKACAGNTAIRAEVGSLLLSHQQADSVLDHPPIEHLLNLPATRMTGRTVGAYRIVREISSGGMAVVYLGERDDQQYRKRVAVKMVRPGVHAEEVLRRFYNERQTLAALDHPLIVKLLDGGSTQEGLPYLVMDFVEGVPIDQYCDQQRLSIPERLRLFCNVCAAVQYAHEKQVVHRDLKPSNILVTAEGVPRLLDFGIAKLLNPELFQTPLTTRTDWRPMTPEYASPEQVRGAAVTPASDIYSLGVLLYELLAGCRPYCTGTCSAGEMERLICEAVPEKPSTAFGRHETVSEPASSRPRRAMESVGGTRRLNPAELRRRLRGDLDTIVLKTLRKEPALRYSSAAELVRDIERHLAGIPIHARRPTLVYRGSKFVRRHKEALATTVLVLCLVAPLAIWKSYFPQNRIAHTLSPARRSIAILGFRNLSNRPESDWISTALSEMLTTELAVGGQLRTVPGETVARARVDLSLPDAESLSAETLGQVRRNLGTDLVVLGSYVDLGTGSEEQIRVDLRLQDTAQGQTLAAVSETGTTGQLLELVSRSGRMLRENLRIGEVSQDEAVGVRASLPSDPEAIRLYAEGLAHLRAFDALAARDFLSRAVKAEPSYPLSHAALSKAWMALGHRANALLEASRALSLAGQLPREEHLQVEAGYDEAKGNWDHAIQTYQTLASLFPDNLEYSLRLAQAQISGERAREAITTLKRLRRSSPQADDDPRTDLAEVEANYSLSNNAGVISAAEGAVTKAKKIGARLLIARALIFECRALASLGKADDSMAACRRSQQAYHDSGDRAGESNALHAWAEVPINQGNLDVALRLYQQALSLAQESGDKRAMAREQGNIGLIYAQQGDFSAGENTYREALDNFREIGDKHGMAVVTGNWGDLLHAEGRLADALALYRDALVLAREVGHRSSEAIDLQLIGDVLAEQGELNSAMESYQQAAGIQREIGEKSYYAFTLMSIGRLQREHGLSNEARKSYEEALALRRQLGEKGTAAETSLAIGELDCDIGKPEEAEALAHSAIAEFRAEKESDHEIQARTLLAKALFQEGKLTDAETTMASEESLLVKSQDVTVKLPGEFMRARLRAAARDFSGAEQIVAHVSADAKRLGFIPLQLEAELLDAQFQLQRGATKEGKVHLAELEKTARAKGFERIATHATAADGLRNH